MTTPLPISPAAVHSTGRHRALKAMAVLALTAGLTLGDLTMAGAAQASALGDKIASQALGQYTSDNAEVRKRRYEGAANGVNAKNNCNFYTGFWTDPRNRRFDGTSAPRTGTNGATCGKSKGYMYIDGAKTWTTVNWKSRAWCSDFAKYTWYWGGAKVTGLNASAASFRDYGRANGTWHTRAQVAANTYVPKKGDAVSYDWEGDGIIDHVGVLTAYSTTYKAYFSVEGNSSDKLTYKNTKQSAVSPYVVGYTSPKPL
ncbi:CHAP domain-containing protein [Streptomyces sp. AP-93]|uniref:CHAP domain-containing protein n=1 Tax=Streptomyces sp. AP-93 TaxID=2929048 RepID=UPI001FAFA4F2|nr:CHAP domain-containing protein [Streptomyces sp. AP-93]MCJ0868329.1 CHAP domain-containing protein [Streptomyces sp. AP-93]